MITVTVHVEHPHGAVEVVEAEPVVGDASRADAVARAIDVATGRAAKRARCAVQAREDA